MSHSQAAIGKMIRWLFARSWRSTDDSEGVAPVSVKVRPFCRIVVSGKTPQERHTIFFWRCVGEFVGRHSVKRTSRSPILVVDDSEDDVFLFRLLLKKIGATAPFLPMLSSAAALTWLDTLAAGHAADQPFVCFLDIRMPQPDGFEILRFVRSQPTLAALPVVMMSTSDEPSDVRKARDLGAQAYVVKYPSTAALSEILAHASAFSDRLPVAADAFQQSYNLICLATNNG